LRLGVLFIPIVYFFLDWPLLDLLTAFLILILFARLIFKTELNDYLYGYLIAIVCLLVGAIYIRDVMFGILFLLFYLVLCWTLILYNLMAERVGSRCPPEKFKRRGGNESAELSLFGLSASLVLASLALTAALFMSFPRVGLGFVSLSSESSPISGFSERVSLGDVGKIKLNQEVAMRVEFAKGGKKFRPPSRIFWRGVVLDHYDSGVWSSTARDGRELKNRRGEGVNPFALRNSADAVRQDVYAEAFDSDIVFTYGTPIHIAGAFRELKIDQSFVVRAVPPRQGPRRYQMISDVSHPETSFRELAPFAEEEEFHPYLQLPELGPRIIRLAGDLSGGDAWEKADKVLDYLRDGFEYSLEMVRETHDASLDEFLFHRKKGHCEYFASAMVILLRLNGIPSRMVNGFVGTEWNEWGGYMVVRQQHAHSWVEAFIPGKGWTVYDPTPPDPAFFSAMDNPVSIVLDILRLNWQRYVIRYSLRDQVQLVHFFSRQGMTMARKLKSLKSVGWEEIATALKDYSLWFFPVAGLLALYCFWRRGWRFFACSRDSQQALAAALYAQMLQRLEKRGIRKNPGWTHLEFLRRLVFLPPEKKMKAQAITAFYEKCRFGGFSFPARDMEKMRRLIHEL
ncbi:MAG: DUF3488 and DUF4129 domain-containing transglutaminase family protein, partial [Nitrospinales bacterium]